VESAADKVEPKPLGRVLAEERERQGLSRTEVAQRMHISARQVESLETGDYAHLPRGPFLRGFVRNYGKLLGLDAAALLAQLAEAAPRSAPDIVVPSQNIRFDPLGERLANPYVKAGVLAVVVVAMALAGMYWWLFIRPAAPGALGKKSGAEQAAAVSPRIGPPQQIAAAPLAPAESVAGLPAPMEAEPSVRPPKAEPAKPEPAKAEPAKAEGGRADAAKRAGVRTLKLRFRGESWVEVKDAQGKVLLSRLNSRGTEAEVAGRPPLTVIVGNAPEVEVVSDGREFPLEPHTKVAVARFTLE
jgi:cytoskeleton protein RodZ